MASKIALLLTGKGKPSFVPYLDMGDEIIVQNVRKVKVTGQKMDQKIYYHHSGYPGGLKKRTMKEVFAKKPSEILKKAVYNMLPKNKLRNGRMKRLKIS